MFVFLIILAGFLFYIINEESRKRQTFNQQMLDNQAKQTELLRELNAKLDKLIEQQS